MASIDDAIFLMDDEVIIDTIKSSYKKAERGISKSVPNDTILMINIAKSPPIDIIKPEKKKIKEKPEFFPSSPYSTV